MFAPDMRVLDPPGVPVYHWYLPPPEPGLVTVAERDTVWPVSTVGVVVEAVIVGSAVTVTEIPAEHKDAWVDAESVT